MSRNPFSTAEFPSQVLAQPQAGCSPGQWHPNPFSATPCKVLWGGCQVTPRVCPWVLQRPCLRPAHLPTKRRERGSAMYFPSIQEVFKDHKKKKRKTCFRRDEGSSKKGKGSGE